MLVYGQTGSGKSYTMEGFEYVMAEKRAKKFFEQDRSGKEMRALISHHTDENQGLTPRVITRFFSML